MTLGARLTHFLPQDVWNHTVEIANPYRLSFQGDPTNGPSKDATIERAGFHACIQQILQKNPSASGASIRNQIIRAMIHLKAFPIQLQEMDTLTGHAFPICKIALSLDGSKLVTTSMDQTMKVSDPITGECLQTFPPGSTMVSLSNAISMSNPFHQISPDGSKLAVTYPDRTIKIWDTATETCLHTLASPIPSRRALRLDNVTIFSPDGSKLAVRYANEVKIWDTDTGNCLYTLAHTNPVVETLFSPDGSKLASVNLRTINIWNTDTGAHLHTLSRNKIPIPPPIFSGCSPLVSLSERLALNPDGSKLASVNAHIINIWDTAKDTPLRSLTLSKRVEQVIFNPDGSKLAFVSTDGTINICDTDTGAHLHTLAINTRSGSRVAFSPCGRFLFCSQNKNLKVYELYSIITRIELAKNAVDLLDQTDHATICGGEPYTILTKDLKESKICKGLAAARQEDKVNPGTAVRAIAIYWVALKLLRSSQ